jgi:hypothetical protein
VIRRVALARCGLVYELTEYGRELEPIVLALGRWWTRTCFSSGAVKLERVEVWCCAEVVEQAGLVSSQAVIPGGGLPQRHPHARRSRSRSCRRSWGTSR